MIVQNLFYPCPFGLPSINASRVFGTFQIDGFEIPAFGSIERVVRILLQKHSDFLIIKITHLRRAVGSEAAVEKS